MGMPGEIEEEGGEERELESGGCESKKVTLAGEECLGAQVWNLRHGRGWSFPFAFCNCNPQAPSAHCCTAQMANGRVCEAYLPFVTYSFQIHQDHEIHIAIYSTKFTCSSRGTPLQLKKGMGVAKGKKVLCYLRNIGPVKILTGKPSF